jgi:hypothetical protein
LPQHKVTLIQLRVVLLLVRKSHQTTTPTIDSVTLPAHMSAKSPSNISSNPSGVIPKVD